MSIFVRPLFSSFPDFPTLSFPNQTKLRT
jgi:hypothetical protein